MPQDTSPENSDAFVSVDYPLRPDVLVTVTVPNDITQIESERLANFIKTLYFQ